MINMIKTKKQQATIDEYWKVANEYIEKRKDTPSIDHAKLYYNMGLGTLWSKCYQLGVSPFD